MAFVGLVPEKARDLSTTMKTGAATADGLSSEVTAALTLSQLESDVPGQLVNTGDELDQVAIVISTRADIVDGFVIDPQTLATDLGITLAQAEAAIEAFSTAENDNTAAITPILDALVENKKQAEILRASFAGLPPLGEDPALDATLARLALWLPAALKAGERPTMTAERLKDLEVLGNMLDTGELTVDPDTWKRAVGSATGDAAEREIHFAMWFDRISRAYELDSRLRTAAGLPTIEDLVEGFRNTVNDDVHFQPRWSALNEWLPAFLAGEGPPSADPAQLALALNLAGHLGWDGDGNPGETWAAILKDPAAGAKLVDGGFSFLKGNRFLQKALIPGDFEGFDSPMIPITVEGLGAAILAGQRNGILTEESQQRADGYARQMLTNPGGGDGPIELTAEHQQALIAAVIQQNGEEFVLEDPNIQRQLVATLLLVGRQPTLAAQQQVFANSIQAFQSLATVGAPSMTFRQIKEAIGPEAAAELGYKDLSRRSADGVAKRPFYLSMLANWGVPGGDKIKTKKRKFKYEFSETGELISVRKKKISKWKRFKNALKAIGKSLWSEWKDNPWKYLFLGYAGLFPGANQLAEGVEEGDFDDIVEGGFEMTKFAATAAAAAFPPSSAPAIVTLAGAAVATVDTIKAVREDNWLGALGSAFGAIGGAASVFKGAAVAGSTANLVKTGAEAAGKVIDTIDAGDKLIDAIDDGEIIDIVGSGFAFAGHAAKGVAAGSEFANSASVGLGGAGDLVSDGLIESISHVGGELSDLSQATVGTGLVIDGVRSGDALLVADGLVTVGSSQVDSESRLGGQLNVIGEGIDVAQIVDRVYQGGAVPDFATLATELTDVGIAAGTVPDAPTPALPPNLQLVDLDGDGRGDGILLGSDGDGNILIDQTGDGQPDAILRPASGPGQTANGAPVDSDGDLIPDHLDFEPTVANNGGDAGGISTIEIGPPLTVGAGQTLSEIAEDYGVSEDAILELNPDITDRHSIREGQNITLPPGAQPTFYPSPARPDGLVPPDPTNPPIPAARPSPFLGDGGAYGPPSVVAGQQFPGGLGLDYRWQHSGGAVIPPNGVVGGQAVSTTGGGGQVFGRQQVFTEGTQISLGSGLGKVGVTVNASQIVYDPPPGGDPAGFVFDETNPTNIPPGAKVTIKTDGTATQAGLETGVGLGKVPGLENTGVKADAKFGVGVTESNFGQTLRLENNGNTTTVTVGRQTSSSVGANAGIDLQTPNKLDIVDPGGGLPDAPVDPDGGGSASLPTVGAGVEVGANTGSTTTTSYRLVLDKQHPASDAALDDLILGGTPPPGASYERVVTESHGGGIQGSVSGNANVIIGSGSGQAGLEINNESRVVETVTRFDGNDTELGSRRTMTANHAQVDQYFDGDGNLTNISVVQNVPGYITGTSDSSAPVPARVVFKPGEIEQRNEIIRNLGTSDPNLWAIIRKTNFAATNSNGEGHQAENYFDLETDLNIRHYLKNNGIELPGTVQFGTSP